VAIDWNGKRRWIALVLIAASVIVMLNWPPVVPVIQLPGENYPAGWDLFGMRITNTFIGSVVVWILIGLMTLFIARNRPQHGGEVPKGGFYNFLEMAFEGLYGFIGNLAPEKYRDWIFKVFFTIFIIVLLSNWLELVPGVDSVGFIHAHAHVDHGEIVPEDGFETKNFLGFSYTDGKCEWISPEVAATLTAEAQAARLVNNCKTGTGQPVVSALHVEEAAHVEETTEGAVVAEPTAEATVVVAAEAEGETEAVEEESHEAEAVAEGETAMSAEDHAAEEALHHLPPGDPSVPWVVTPFVRVPSTDLNMTLGLALCAIVIIQIIGFKALGPGYLIKFFNFRNLAKSPLGGIDLAVSLLELIGEFAKILSFAFRLLGNIFAGSILLFVMTFLVPVLIPIPFFLLEFFVGIIQALVFGMLTAIFMGLATVGHGGEHHEEGHGEHAPEAAH
jgi:F-type H+-transporting ATPase subunit a